jgi:hypothetical protein
MATMEQNNFEKNVQQKLDELKIPPSDSVWTNIEKNIGKKKKDRTMILIFLFLILILLSGGYWLFNSGKNNQQIHISKVLKKDSKPTNTLDSFFNKHSISLKKNNTEPVSNKNKILKKFNEQIVFKSKGKKIISENKVKSNSILSVQLQTKNKEDSISSIDMDNISVQERKLPAPGNKNRDTKDTISNLSASDSLSLHEKLKKTGNNEIEKQDLFVVKKDSKNRKKKPWLLGITFSVGRSLSGNSVLGINNYYADAAMNNGGSSSPYATPSLAKTSTGFIAGVFVEKNISLKNKISFGISYQFFSLTNKVGTRIDSLVNSPQAFNFSSYFYSVASNTNTYRIYRNNFHYLEVPVSIKFQVNKSKDLPLFLNAGINISELISSNALQFQSIPGIYYNDNSMFNKTNFGFHAGFFGRFFSEEKYPLAVGPLFYYNATTIANKGLYQNKHFSFIGIQAEILFNKK